MDYDNEAKTAFGPGTARTDIHYGNVSSQGRS